MEECKLKSIHKKFDEAFVLWEQAFENYFNPQRFVANINAAIQALRNITFTLQAEKHAINDFDEWYKPWQQQMKEDEAMLWLHNSRTKIVHEKDFEIHSRSIVKVYDYATIFIACLQVPIQMPNEAIVGFLLSQKYIHPQMITSELIMEIERAWIAPTYPKCDVLELLLCCLPFFHNLIVDAHKQAEISIDDCNYFKVQKKDKLHDKIQSLIESLRKPMIQKMSLRDLIPVEIETIIKTPDAEGINIAKKRYGSPQKTVASKSVGHDDMEMFFAAAKTIMKIDGYHQPMAFLFHGDGPPMPMAFDFENRASKYLAMEKLAEVVKSKDIDKVILITESYIFSMDQRTTFFKNMNIEEVPDKKEVLSFVLLQKGASTKHYNILFERDSDGNVISFHEPTELNDVEPNFVMPILRVWGDMKVL